MDGEEEDDVERANTIRARRSCPGVLASLESVPPTSSTTTLRSNCTCTWNGIRQSRGYEGRCPLFGLIAACSRSTDKAPGRATDAAALLSIINKHVSAFAFRSCGCIFGKRVLHGHRGGCFGSDAQ